jgi:hypothetical protein
MKRTSSELLSLHRQNGVTNHFNCGFSSELNDISCSVMLLGSGELGKEVIIALQRLGVEVQEFLTPSTTATEFTRSTLHLTNILA